MRAKNIHKTPFNLESGPCGPGGEAEFTGAEFMFLAKMGRAEIVIEDDQEEIPEVRPLTPAEKGAATKAAKKAAAAEATPPNFG